MILGEVDLKRTVKEIALPHGASYGSHEVIEGAPIRQLVGFESCDVTLRGRWHQERIDIWPTHDAVFQLVESGEIVDLQFANGDVWSSFVVMKITLSSMRMLPDETVIACDFEIALGDPGGIPDVAPKPVAVTSLGGRTDDTPGEDRSVPKNDVTPAQIARRP